MDGQNNNSRSKKSGAAAGGKKVTPALLYKKLIAFGKVYQINGEQDFLEAARVYAEEAGLIQQMRDILEKEGLTVYKTYKTGDQLCSHPLLSELPRHIESANKCLSTIGEIVIKRGVKTEHAPRALDSFRLY